MTVYSKAFENITLHGALALRDSAMSSAQTLGIAIAIAVIDLQGVLVLAQTMDDTSPGAAEAALMKAKGAARYRVATHLTAKFAKTLPAQLAQHALSLPDLCAFQGGVPIKIDGRVIGGLGVAGGSGAQDIEIAMTATDGMAAANGP
jgi:glc operon protein GlcG